MPALEIEDVSMTFGGVKAVQHVSMTIAPGERVGLIGPNGAGKSTLMSIISGFRRPTAGTIRSFGTDITRWGATRRVQYGIGRAFQHPELFESLTLGESLRIVPGAERDRIGEVVEALELGPYVDQLNSSLPYGVRKLSDVARGVLVTTKLLLLDEPGAGLAEADKNRVRHALDCLAGDRGWACLVVDHDIDFVLSTVTRLYVLNFGELMAEGEPREVLARDAVAAAYVGGWNTHG
ncbi:MAG: ATP-binding cassette domain-containing protein [Nocardioidaceae bacterium]